MRGVGGPARELAAGLAQHPAPERDDQPALLGDGHERARQHDALAGVAPAHERLDGHDAALVEVDERLVVELELVALERVAQVVLEREALDHAAADVLVEELVARAAQVLGALHRHVGVAHERLGAVAEPVGDGDAEAGVDEDGLVAEHDRRGEAVEQPLGDLDRPALPGQALAQDGELVAAQPRERVAGREQRGEPRGELGQQLVAALVAEPVVDELEAVDVEPEHRGGAAVARGERERVVDAVDEQRAVRQPGQRIVEGAVPGLLLERDDAAQGVVELRAARERPGAHALKRDAGADCGSFRSISAQKAATTIGSNWCPAQRRSSSNAVATGSASR